MAVPDPPFPSPKSCCGFTVFARLAYIYCGERHSRSQRPENQRDDREADSCCGPNPQRGEPSCRSRPRISSPSHAFLQPAISAAEIAGVPTFHLIVPRSRALMVVWLTTPRRETTVGNAIEDQIAELGRLTVTQLRQKYAEVFGEETRSNNKQFLYRRIAWRIQALAEGGLSERARRRALEIANDADLRIRAPKKKVQNSEAFLKVSEKLRPQDPRLPAPGSEVDPKGWTKFGRFLDGAAG